MTTIRLAHVAVAALSTLCLSSAQAGTVKVSPKGPITSIQAGVDEAGPGDTVSIASGVYFEVVRVPEGKDGLKIVGKGKVILDARPDGEGRGAGIGIESDDVTVQGLTIRHADTLQMNEDASAGGPSFTEGAGIRAFGDGISVLKCAFLNNQGRSVTINGDDARIDGCHVFVGGETAFQMSGDRAQVTRNTIRSPDGLGMYIAGDDAVVERNQILNAHDTGVEIDGDRARVAKNNVRVPGSYGIDVGGDDAIIDRNTIFAACSDGILVDGDGARITGNRLDDIESDGVNTDGANVLISKNRITRANDGGIDSNGANGVIDRNIIECALGDDGIELFNGTGSRITGNKIESTERDGILAFGDDLLIDKNSLSTLSGNGISVYGGTPTITRNTIRDPWCDGNGIYATSASPTSGLIENNRIDDATDHGIFVDGGAGVIVSKNRITNAGNSREDGIYVSGSGHQILDNTVQGAVRDGIHVVAGSNVVVDGNKVSGCAEDGIDIESGSDNEVTFNNVSNNGAEGIENEGSGSVIEDNRSKGNRFDYASSEEPASFARNTSGDGTDADTPKPEIDN